MKAKPRPDDLLTARKMAFLHGRFLRGTGPAVRTEELESALTSAVFYAKFYENLRKTNNQSMARYRERKRLERDLKGAKRGK